MRAGHGIRRKIKTEGVNAFVALPRPDRPPLWPPGMNRRLPRMRDGPVLIPPRLLWPIHRPLPLIRLWPARRLRLIRHRHPHRPQRPGKHKHRRLTHKNSYVPPSCKPHANGPDHPNFPFRLTVRAPPRQKVCSPGRPCAKLLLRASRRAESQCDGLSSSKTPRKVPQVPR
jgi:hypothetical protein